MAEVKKLKFLSPRGYGAMRFATGCTADVPEPWATRFINQGAAVEVEAKPKVEKPAEPKKPTAKKGRK